MKTKLSPKFWCALTLFSLVGQVAWVVENMYFNVFIYNMFGASAADISAMVAASAVAATLTTVFMGALSDRVGKRKLFIVGGYILWGVSILCFALLRIEVIEAIFPMTVSAAAVGVSLTIIFDCVMTFFGSTANDAAFNAWLTDSTDASNRGAAEGINSMMPLVAILVVFGGFMAFDLKQAESWSTIFIVIGSAVILLGIAGCFLIKDPKLEPTKSGYFSNIFHGFLPSTVKQNTRLYIALAAFAVFNISIQIFMPYLILYYEVSLAMSDYVLVMAPAIILASVVTALWGRVYDKAGFGISVCISLAWLAAGYVILFFARATVPVFIGSLLMMCGYLSGMAVFGALIRDNTPEGKAGRFQGLRIFAQVLIPGVIGPAIGAAVLADAETVLNNDGTTSFIPNEWIFLAALAAVVVLIPCVALLMRKKQARTVELATPYEQDVGETPWSDYPRPQLKRESFVCLNGKWSLAVKKPSGAAESVGEILVPYPPESHVSGIGRRFDKRDTLVYERSFTLDKNFNVGRVLLHFGAVDQYCDVFLNGTRVGGHEGGYLPFESDVTDALRDGANDLRVEVRDPLDRELAYGKQREKRGGMWYTPTSGIWQTVWLESVPREYIKRVKITPDLEGVDIEIEGGIGTKTLVFEDKRYEFEGEKFRLDVEHPEHWTPENPKLYDFVLECGDDRIESYFALRTVSVGKVGKYQRILLNGEPYFFHGLLDQGYFSDGIYLPATSDGYLQDVLRMKELGFNMLRKHIKIEPDVFYYFCDRYGMVVFQDLVNSGGYSFLVDTGLPTVGLRKGISHRASARRREAFLRDARETVELLYSHPSVCYYTIFNEGWGQFDAKNVYREVSKYDRTRVWDATSGWFHTGESDVQSEHIYFKAVALEGSEKPLVLSEFGGYVFKVDGHSFNLDETYGYKFFASADALTDGIEKLYREEIVPCVRKGLCAAVYTQVSDVEDETNGLLTYDRQVLKVDKERMRRIAEELRDAMKE